jgi:hypothetical protein
VDPIKTGGYRGKLQYLKEGIMKRKRKIKNARRTHSKNDSAHMSFAEYSEIIERARAVEKSVENGTYNRGPGYDDAFSVWGL